MKKTPIMFEYEWKIFIRLPQYIYYYLFTAGWRGRRVDSECSNWKKTYLSRAHAVHKERQTNSIVAYQTIVFECMVRNRCHCILQLAALSIDILIDSLVDGTWLGCKYNRAFVFHSRRHSHACNDVSLHAANREWLLWQQKITRMCTDNRWWSTRVFN